MTTSTTQYWVIVPVSEANSTSVPSNAVIYKATTAAQNNALSNFGHVSYKGQTYVSFFAGSFSTEAQAKTAAPEGLLAQVDTDIVGGVASSLGTGAATGGSTATAASNYGTAAENTATSWEQALAKFFGDVTTASLWVRVGKVVIGGTLLLIAFAKMTNMDNKIANAAIKVAPFL